MSDRRLDAVLGKPALPRIRAAQCLRRRPHGGDCTVCQDVCPSEALWVDGEGRLRLDEAACVGCGACASACPSQAIDGAWADLAALRRTVRRGADTEAGATVGCRMAGDGAPAGDVAVSCLAALHAEQLATLMLEAPEAPLALDLRRCGGCAIGRLRPSIEAAAERASAYARAARVAPKLRLEREGPAAAPAQPAVSRRALFGLARDRAATMLVDAVADAASDGAPSLPHRVDLLTAARRGAAERADVDDAPRAPSEKAFYLDWSVSDTCDGCGGDARPRCVSACPTGAWRFGRSGGRATLTVDAAICTACGACAAACPQDALTAHAAPIAADAGRTEKRVLASARCRACRRPVQAGGDGLCANCRKREGATLGRPTTGAAGRARRG